jgi:mRNA-degrading endonuclease RelE of RelBE toxin-antitoxin system
MSVKRSSSNTVVRRDIAGNRMLYRIEYSPHTIAHLQALTARQRSLVLTAVEEQLSHQPTVETRNRKPMRPNPLAPWELRVEECRVYYDVWEDPEQVVMVLAVGVKDRARVIFGGEAVE